MVVLFMKLADLMQLIYSKDFYLMIVGRYNMHAEEIKLEKSKKVRN